MIPRILEARVQEKLFKGKAILLFGARQTGKTTLIEAILQSRSEKVLFLNGDDADIRESLSGTNLAQLKILTGKHRVVFIDEAQRIPEIGLTLKIFTDRLKDVQIIATGSSSFELASKTVEPLTGRKWEFLLFPLSFQEMIGHHGLLEEKRQLEQRLIFGLYPEIVMNQAEAKIRLKELASSYLYKDILALSQIHKATVLEKLLKAVALQIGSEVSISELGQTVGADSHTVEKYLDILEKAFIVFRLPALSRNLRNELKKSKKIYFFDNGIRNAVLGSFLPLRQRTDAGALWENFLVSERKKRCHYRQDDGSGYFWRTTAQQEIDYVEECNGEFSAFEFKFNPKARSRFPRPFLSNYNVKQTLVVTPKNLEDFLL